MTTVTYQVAADADDGYWYTGTVSVTSNVRLYLGGAGAVISVFARVTGVAIPAGATVDSAVVSLMGFGGEGTVGHPAVAVRADKQAASPQITSDTDANGRTLTTASVTWNVALSNGSFVDSPDITSVIQELVTAYGASLTAIQIMLVYSGASSGNYEVAHSYFSSAANAPKLTITYHVPVTGHRFRLRRSGGGSRVRGNARLRGLDGSLQTVTASGTITPAGALVRTANKALAGSTAPAGTLTRLVNKLFSGSTTPAGALVRTANKSFTGSAAPAGVLTLTKIRVVALAGTITPVGTLIRQMGRTFSGTITPVGVLVKLVSKNLSGAVTPAGALTRTPNKSFAGSTTPAGTLAAVKVKVVTAAGTITPVGVVTRQANKLFAGTVTPAGALKRTVNKLFAGTITPVGTLVKQVNKLFSGSTTPAGAVTMGQARNLNVSGTITPAGALKRTTVKSFLGTITPAGVLAVSSTAFLTRVNVVGRVLRLDGRPASGAVVTIEPQQVGGVASSVPNPGVLFVRRTTEARAGADGTFLLSVVGSANINPSGMLYRLVLLGQRLINFFVPTTNTYVYPDGTATNTPPSWSAPTTCAVTGTLTDGSGTARPGVTLRFALDVPPDRPIFLTDHTQVASQPVDVTTAADGTWSVSLIRAVNFAASGVFVVMTGPNGMRARFQVPNTSTATLASLV